MSSRREPGFGPPPSEPSDTAEFRADYRPRRPPAPAPRPRWPWLLAAGLLVGAAIGLYLFRESLADRLLPEPRRTQLLDDAAAALAAGRLSSPDGRGARELYTAVLALDPDQREAREGLARVARAALAQARQRLDAGDREGARGMLALARTLAAPAAELAPVENELRRLDAEESELARLLAAADNARRAGRLDGGVDSAIALYRQALAAEPASAIARAGLQAVLADLVGQAHALLDAGDEPGAAALAARVEEVDAAHLELPALKARLGERSEVQGQTLSQHLADADAFRREGRLDAARDAYRAILAVVPDDARARQGLEQLAAAYAQQAARAAADLDFEAAEAHLSEARVLAPGHPAIHDAESRLLQARARAAQVEEAPLASSPEVERLLAEAARAVAARRFADPPGDSAWDILRNARALAPNDERVYRAIEALVPAARRCVEDEMAANRLSQAGVCLDAIMAMNPAEASLGELRRRLVARWIGLAEERLGAGELAQAERALRVAQGLDPNHAGLPALAARIEQARLARPR